MAATTQKRSAAQQLFHELRGRIERGELPVGSKLPSVRELASAKGVSINTAQLTLARLSAQNLIRSAAGRASVVVARSSRIVPTQMIHGRQVAVVHEVSHLQDQRDVSAWRWGSVVTSSLGAAMHRHGAQLVMTPYVRSSPDPFASVREQFDRLEDKLIGVICFPGTVALWQEKLMERRAVPCVTINRTSRQWSYNFVSADYLGAGRSAGRYFASVDSRHVALLGGDVTASMSWQEIASGVIQSYLSAQMPHDAIRLLRCEARGGPMDEAEGYRATSEYLREHANSPPDGILAGGDYLALGAIRACREAGLSVPGDVNVIGGAGHEMSKFTDPPLSVIAQPTERIGHEAADLLVEMIQLGAERLPGRILPTPVALRGSTRIPDDVKNQSQQVDSEYHLYDAPA